MTRFPEDALRPAQTLAMAVIESSQAPVLLMQEDCTVLRASKSFCAAFGLRRSAVEGRLLAELGEGEWAAPQLRSLLSATFAGTAAVDAYEMDLLRPGHDPACVILNAHLLDYDAAAPMVVLTVTDVTSARLAARIKDDLVAEKQVLLQELQHRVANSLQIIASVLMQSARRVQSEETRLHLKNAHHRVLSISALQRQLALSSDDSVKLREYFENLCASIGASMIDDQQRISLTTTTDGTIAPANISTSLGLIVTELVINSLKHAFPGDGQKGAILVDYKTLGKGFSLVVSDNGVGIAASDEPVTPGLGTGIVEALARQLGAAVTTSDAHPGTKVEVVRPTT